MPRVDLVLQAEVGVGLDAAGRAHRRHAVRQIEPRRAERHLRNDERLLGMARRIEVRPLQIEQMVVHPDDARDHGRAGQVEQPVTLRHGGAGRLDRGNVRTIDQRWFDLPSPPRPYRR